MGSTPILQWNNVQEHPSTKTNVQRCGDVNVCEWMVEARRDGSQIQTNGRKRRGRNVEDVVVEARVSSVRTDTHATVSSRQERGEGVERAISSMMRRRVPSTRSSHGERTSCESTVLSRGSIHPTRTRRRPSIPTAHASLDPFDSRRKHRSVHRSRAHTPSKICRLRFTACMHLHRRSLPSSSA